MKGWVRMKVEGLGAEKMLNALWQKRIPLRAVRRSKKRGLVLSVPQRYEQQVKALAEEKGFAVTLLSGGMRQLLYDMKKRWALAAGLVLGMALAVSSLQFIWLVEVEDAGRYTGEVRLFLQEEGIGPGVAKSRIEPAALQEKLLWRLPEVKWVWVRQEGVRLHIRLEEGIAAEKGEGAMDVVARMDGVLERLTVFSGTALCREGDAVREGQVLIAGWEEDREGRKVPVQASGEAMARVWLEKRIRMQTEEMITTPTGNVQERILYKTPFGTFTFQPQPEYLMADISSTVLPLPGVWLPFQVIRVRYEECSGEYVERDMETVTKEARKAAVEALVRAWPETADIDKSTKISMIERGSIEVLAVAELTRDIAQYGQAP